MKHEDKYIMIFIIIVYILFAVYVIITLYNLYKKNKKSDKESFINRSKNLETSQYFVPYLPQHQKS